MSITLGHSLLQGIWDSPLQGIGADSSIGTTLLHWHGYANQSERRRTHLENIHHAHQLRNLWPLALFFPNHFSWPSRIFDGLYDTKIQLWLLDKGKFLYSIRFYYTFVFFHYLSLVFNLLVFSYCFNWFNFAKIFPMEKKQAMLGNSQQRIVFGSLAIILSSLDLLTIRRNPLTSLPS